MMNFRISYFRMALIALVASPQFVAEGFGVPLPIYDSTIIDSNSKYLQSPRSPAPLRSAVSYEDSTGDPSSISGEQTYATLVDAIGFNASAATTLLSELGKLRERGASRETVNAFLDDLLSKGPDSPLPFWARSKRLGRFSRRARMSSLRRTIDRTTPPANDNEDSNKEQEQVAERRRRTLVSVLRSIVSEAEEEVASKDPLIVRVEKRAIQAEKDDATNLRNRLPQGLETPKYEIIPSQFTGSKNIEIRKYAPYSVCAVSMNKPRPASSGKTDAKLQMPEMGGASSFGALAGYLFGKNEESTAMKMTTPVFTSPLAEGDRQMEFVLPSNYWDSVTTAPKPFSDSGVTLQEKRQGYRAVLMFGGYASKTEVERRKKDLFAALDNDLEWKSIDEEPTVAQYNDPFTPAWKRLNEVSIGVEHK
jgi:SOUL heme-binding protein